MEAILTKRSDAQTDNSAVDNLVARSFLSSADTIFAGLYSCEQAADKRIGTIKCCGGCTVNCQAQVGIVKIPNPSCPLFLQSSTSQIHHTENSKIVSYLFNLMQDSYDLPTESIWVLLVQLESNDLHTMRRNTQTLPTVSSKHVPKKLILSTL